MRQLHEGYKALVLQAFVDITVYNSLNVCSMNFRPLPNNGIKRSHSLQGPHSLPRNLKQLSAMRKKLQETCALSSHHNEVQAEFSSSSNSETKKLQSSYSPILQRQTTPVNCIVKMFESHDLSELSMPNNEKRLLGSKKSASPGQKSQDDMHNSSIEFHQRTHDFHTSFLLTPPEQFLDSERQSPYFDKVYSEDISRENLRREKDCLHVPKSRDNLMREFLNFNETLKQGFHRRRLHKTILDIEKILKDLYDGIDTKLKLLREDETCLTKEYQANKESWRMLEERFFDVVDRSKAEKLHTHSQEIEKIVALASSLSGRLSKVMQAIDSCEWNGVEEREELERKKCKLVDQFEEAKILWRNIERRAESIADIIRIHLGDADVMMFKMLTRKKILLLLEKKEIEENIESTLKQSNTINYITSKQYHFS